MSYDFAGLDWSLATVLGDDAALLTELRQALIADAKAALDLLCRSRCDANWAQTSKQMKSLAASFGASRLAAAADLALELAPGDPAALREIAAAIAALDLDASGS